MQQVIESSGYGADKFTMVRNNDGTGSLKIVQSLDYEDQLQSNGFRFRIQVNDKVSRSENSRFFVHFDFIQIIYLCNTYLIYIYIYIINVR